jgi:hypothetical protein
MIYNFTILSSKNGNKNSPDIMDLKVCNGVIHKLDILFPPGCAGLVGIAIHSAIHQIWPSNPGEFFSSDAETISFREHHAITTEPYLLQAYYYNEDDTYDHEIIVRLGILPVSVVAPWLQSYNERLLAALGAE